MNRKKKYFAVGVCLLALLVAVYLYLQDARDAGKSPLHQAVSAGTGEDALYPESSGEGLFLRGLAAFKDGDHAGARDLFERAMEAPGSDPALPGYLYAYINQCIYQLDGAGSPELVARALEEMARCAPLANDTDLLWKLISTISLPDGDDAVAIEQMQSYLTNTAELELHTWAWLRNCIAMLEYNNGEYARSIRGFYDVELALTDAKMTPDLQTELRYAKEYIANIHYIFEDYEKTAVLYQELIDDAMDDDSFHAYGCCLNMANACLEIPDTVSARRAVEILEENLHRVEEDIVAEVEASMNDVYANICLQENDTGAADAYLDKAEAFYRENSGNEAFLGGDIYIRLTRCKYLVQTDALQEAQDVLEEMLGSGDAAYYGLEKEAYRLLEEICAETGQTEKRLEIYQRLLELDREFARTTQREYLEFSAYYRDVNQLSERNTRLSRANTISLLVILIISAALILVLLLVRMLRTRNLTDQLTGVCNRKKLNQIMRACRRSGTPANLGVVMMDIDYFKRYNDTYGHPAGDEVLREVAKVLTGCVRGKDVIIRYGGEEFLALLHDVSAQTAEEICRRIHDQLAARALPHAASDVADHVTLSMGLCHQTQAGSASLDRLIELADGCLYQSKENGRNRVTATDI